jgi:signal transduction histidine kinase
MTWSAHHGEELLTALALPVLAVTAAPSGHAPTALELVLVALTWLPLTVRTRWPVPVAIVVGLLDTVRIVVAGHGTPSSGTLPAATMLALYTVGVRASSRVTWTLAATTAAVQYVTALLAISDHSGPDLLYLNWALVAALVGRLVRERAERIAAAEARAEQAELGLAREARRQVIEERMRIARELHDVLAHHITVVNAQAGVAQYLLKTNPEAAELALAGVADNTRAALDELRATLGLLRSDTDTDGPADDDPLRSRTPIPGAEQLAQLFDRFATSGIRIQSRVAGSPYPLPAAADLALYRIAQEALTNAAKHAPGAAVEISLDWADDEVVLSVTNTVATSSINANPNGHRSGTGHGLLGMRERAAAADGTLTAERNSGGWVVHLRLPRRARPVPAEARA